MGSCNFIKYISADVAYDRSLVKKNGRDWESYRLACGPSSEWKILVVMQALLAAIAHTKTLTAIIVYGSENLRDGWD